MTGSATTSPRASAGATRTVSSGATRDRTCWRASSSGITAPSLGVALYELGEKAAELRTDVRPFGREFHGCPQEVELVADVVTPALERHPEDVFVAQQQR